MFTPKNAIFVSLILSTFTTIESMQWSVSLIQSTYRWLNGTAKKASQELIKAAQKGDTQRIKTLLKIPGIQLDVGDEFHQTALMEAAGNGHRAIVCLLLEAAQTSNAGMLGRMLMASSGINGSTALIRACEAGYAEIVDDLLAMMIHEDITPIHAQIMLHHRQSTRSTPLIIAAHAGHTSVVQSLLKLSRRISLPFKRKALLVDTNMNGYNAFLSAVSSGSRDIMHLLIEESEMLDTNQTLLWQMMTTVGSSGETALIIAAQKGYAHLIELIITTLKKKVTHRYLLDNPHKAVMRELLSKAHAIRIQEKERLLSEPLVAEHLSIFIQRVNKQGQSAYMLAQPESQRFLENILKECTRE